MAAVPPVPPMIKLRYTADLPAGFAFPQVTGQGVP
jgi:hypothetical protein